jgi:plastocyanin
VKLTIGSPTPTVLFALAADQTVAPGDYNVKVAGTSGSLTENLSFTVTVAKYLVIAQGNSFSPSTLTVTTGSTVYWLNLDSPGGQDPEVHNVIITSLNFHSSDISPVPNSGSVKYTFSTAGTYSYFCAYHAGMNGKVTVTAG